MYVQMILFIHMIPLFFTLPCWLENLHRWFSQEEPLLSAISSIVTILGVVAVFVYYRKVRISRNCRRKIILDLTRHLFVNCAIVEATRLCMQRSGGAERPVDGTFLRFAFLEDDTNLERFSLTSKSFDLIHELNLFMRNYNIAAGVAESHFADPAYPVELKARDLDDLFSRAVKITLCLLDLAKGFKLKVDEPCMVGYLRACKCVDRQGIFPVEEAPCALPPRDRFDRHGYYDRIGLAAELDRCILNRLSTFHTVPMDMGAGRVFRR